MKKILLTTVITGAIGVTLAQTKVYHGIGINAGFPLENKQTSKNMYIQPEYEVNVLREGERFTQGFAGGAGMAIHTIRHNNAKASHFLVLKGGYKIDAFAFGLMANFMDSGTGLGGWFNANVSETLKFQVSYSKHSYTTAGLIYFPAYINKK